MTTPNKKEALEYVRTLGQHEVLTKDELVAAFDGKNSIKPDGNKRLGASELLYYIGGGVIFLGIAILLTQNWLTLEFSTKVLATLGAGIAAYFAGLLLGRDTRTETAAPAFYLISALVTPIGLGVLWSNAGYDVGSPGVQSLMAGIMFITYVLSFWVLRKNIFVLFSILFGTWLYFSLTGWVVTSTTMHVDEAKFYEYRLLIAGLVYMLLGYLFAKGPRASLHGFLYGTGVLGLLGAAFALGGWRPEQSVVWELIYPAFVFGGLFLSVHVKSRAVLTWSTVFLMLYVLKVTSEYFASSLSWPLTLVLAGLAIMGVGYMSLALRRKFMNS